MSLLTIIMNKTVTVFVLLIIVFLSACSSNKKVATIEPKKGLSKILPKYWGKGGVAILEPFEKGVYIAQTNDTTPKIIENIKILVNDLTTYNPEKRGKKSTTYPTSEAPIKLNIATANPTNGKPIEYFFKKDTIICTKNNYLMLTISTKEIDLNTTPIFIKISPLTNLEYKRNGFEGPPVFPLIGNYNKNSFVPFTKNSKNEWELDTYLANRKSIYQIWIELQD